MRSLRAFFAVTGVAAVVAVVVACGGGDLKAAGEACVASSDCSDGLVCDFGQSPPVCSQMGSPPPPPGVDAPEGGDEDGGIDAPVDARPIDAAVDAAVDAPDAL